MPDIESRINELLNKDFSTLSANEIIQIATGGQDLSMPYVDLQSEEGFNEELQKVQKDVDALIADLENPEPPIPISEIEQLSCQYDGDELYAKILLRSLQKDRKSLYDEIVLQNPEYLDDYSIKIDDIGVKSNIKSLNTGKKILSDKISNFIKSKDPDFLRKTDEKLFDHIDPLLVAKPSNSGGRKKRELKILGFSLPLEFIMDGSKILHVRIDVPDLTPDEAIKKINESLKKQYKNSKPCDFKDRTELEKDSQEEARTLAAGNNNTNINNQDNIESNFIVGRTDNYDSQFFPDGNDPIDQDCTPRLTQDSITGDIIITKENIENILKDFCDPDALDLSETGANQEDNVPDSSLEPPKIDIKAIQACLDSALEKSQKIEDDSKIVSRWQTIERNLEEIFYHYDIIYEYQKTLAETWRSRRSFPLDGSPGNLQISIRALTYLDQERELSRDISFAEEDYNNSKKIFLQTNSIFTDKLFSISIPDTELSEDLLKKFFQDLIDSGNSPITYNNENKTWPIEDSIVTFKASIEDIRYILLKNNFIAELKQNRDNIIALKNEDLITLSRRSNKTISDNNLQKAFTNETGDIFDFSSDQIERNRMVFNQYTSINTYEYESYGYKFLQEIKEFSIRFKDVAFKDNIGELQFPLTFVNDYGNPLPYKQSKKTKRISIDGTPIDPMVTVSEPDIEKIRIGNEYAGNGGLLYGYPTDFFKSSKSDFFGGVYGDMYGKFLTVNNIPLSGNDIAPFYDFIQRVIQTSESKDSIIQRIVSERGVLYGNLIEKSASPWLFFTANERGDNDARNPKDLRPGSYNQDGEPTPVFSDFWGNFKSKWDAKYLENKNAYIIPKLNSVKEQARRAGLGLGNTLSTSDLVGLRIFENYFDIKKKIEQLQEALLVVAQKIQEFSKSLTPESLESSFSDLKCTDSGDGNDENNGSNKSQGKCPPECCGNPGTDFLTGNFLTSSPPPSDCPTIYQICWWKQFCKDITKVGLLPYPNGLPPIEDTVFFLGGGPSIRLGLKYWPVGYLPPSFIPIPIPNPIDGQPFIRIPLPMIWTIIKPIIIPLPLNLGIIVIFIPMIGGFMPSPLIYVKEFVMGNSFFLTGIRGPRFIPRKSDPKINDPLEKFKQVLSFGIPNKLIPLPGFGQDNIDSPERILKDLQKNYTKILDSIPPPSNVTELRNLQQKENDVKSRKAKKKRDYDRKAALSDDPEPDYSAEYNELNEITSQRKSVLINLIKDYVKNGIPNPKSVVYPKDKDKLKVDIPGAIKASQSTKDMKSSYCSTTSPDVVNLKDDLKESLKKIKIETPTEYDKENKGISNQNKIYSRDKDPKQMNNEEFKALVNKVKSAVGDITKTMLDGNKVSVDKNLRSGVFSKFSMGQMKGVFTFPSIKITENIPEPPLNFTKSENPYITSTKKILQDGMDKAEYTPEDFEPFVRYEGDNPVLIMRVKDLKKITAKKMGLGKKRPNEPDRPADLVGPKLSKFPNPKGPLNSSEDISSGFIKAISAFELPVSFPPKQDQISQTPMAGGIIQTTIPGSIIKNFIIEAIEKQLENGAIEKFYPEINDTNSPKFTNIEPGDIQKMTRTMIENSLNPDSGNIPAFLNIAKIPVIPQSRPTDLIEQILIGMGVPPPARLVFSLLWKYWKGVPKTPLIKDINQVTALSTTILSKIPWPIVVLLGRNVINIINPMVMSDDLPTWRRMSLKNAYYVVYLDEFLRSAADVSGMFKFFLGAADPVYPLPELPSELKKAFNIKKY